MQFGYLSSWLKSGFPISPVAGSNLGAGKTLFESGLIFHAFCDKEVVWRNTKVEFGRYKESDRDPHVAQGKFTNT